MPFNFDLRMQNRCLWNLFLFGVLFSLAAVGCLVPWLSLGPLLFMLYVAEVAEVLAAHGFKGHSYADDTQRTSCRRGRRCSPPIRLHRQHRELDEQPPLEDEPDKTQLLWRGTRSQLSKVAVNEVALSTGPLGFSTVLSNLGVLFDEQLGMADHVTAVCKSCMF